MPRITLDANEDHPTRFRHYRAPDPEWAGPELLERVRERLVGLDPRLNLWWNPNWKDDDPVRPGRWAVMFWLERTRFWSVVFYHEDPAGAFLPITPECIEPMLRRIKACEEDVKKLSDRIDRERRERIAREAEIMDRGLDVHTMDAAERIFGIRQTFGPGMNRKRRRAQARIQEAARTAASIAADIGKDRAAEHERIRQRRIEREFGGGA